MAYKITINSKTTYDIKDGFLIKEEFNETLDSATIQFNTYAGELEAVPFDDLVITDDNNKITRKPFLVDTYDDEIYSFGSDFSSDSHSYVMNLFSETKLLERITLPSCSVTQPITAGATKKTVWDEIRRFCVTYLPKIKIYDNYTGFHYSNEFELDSILETKFNSIICPEFQWNEPTLREVLNDLMSTLDCIVVVKNKIISCYSLIDKGNPIDTTKLTLSKKSITSADYCGELTINMQNAIGKDVTRVCEKKGLRSVTGELTTDNALFITQQPIYNIKSCKISYFYFGNARATYHKEVDITDFIVEKDVYDVASAARYAPYGDSIPNDWNPTAEQVETAKGYRHYLLYYKRGSNTIEGWGETMKTSSSPAATAVPHIGWICAILNKIGTGTAGASFCCTEVSSEKDIRGIHVDLIYETISGHSMHVGKYLPTEHPDNRIFDNQSNSYVDVNHQSIFEYAKVNRLGNKLRLIQGEYFNESDIPEIGDYIGDEILFSREIIYYDDILYFKGYLIANYILRDYFTGVRAKKRSWQLAKESEALTRADVVKIYAEFSFARKTDDIYYIDNNLGVANLPYWLCNGLIGHTYGISPKYCAIHTVSSLPIMQQDTYLQLDLDKEIQGMSLCFNFKAMDNAQVDYYNIYNEDDNVFLSGIYKYCDSNGEFLTMNIIFSNTVNDLYFPEDGDYWYMIPNPDDPGHNPSEGEIIMKTVLSEVNVMTAIPYNMYSVVFGVGSLWIEKDNREIIQSHLQFEYCSDTPDIIVKPGIIEHSSLIDDNTHTVSQYRFYYSLTETYNVSDTKGKGGYENGAHIALTSLDKYSVEISTNDAPSVSRMAKSWAVCDADGNILLAVNGNSTKSVYVNLLRTRDTNIYVSQTDRRVVGTIADDTQTLAARRNNINVFEPVTKIMGRTISQTIDFQPYSEVFEEPQTEPEEE